MSQFLKNTITKTKPKMDIFEVECIQCGGKIESDNVNIDTSLAKCKNCSSIFSIEETAFEKRRRGHPIFLVPDGTEILKLITKMEISTSWLKASKKDKIKFDFIMAFTFGFISTIMLTVGILDASLFVILISSIFMLISIFLTYNFLANLINRTIIKIENKTLKITHTPLKLFTQKQHNIPVDQIKQLYVKEHTTNRSVNNVPLKAFGIYLEQSNGEEIKLIDEMNRETSLYLEQEIEEFIKIKDKAIEGEIDKT